MNRAPRHTKQRDRKRAGREKPSCPSSAPIMYAGDAFTNHRLARLAEQPVSREELAAVVRSRKWFPPKPERWYRLRSMAPGEMGVDLPNGVVVVKRLLPTEQSSFANRSRNPLWRHWRENRPDSKTAPADVAVRSLLAVYGDKRRGISPKHPVTPAAAQVRLWLRPTTGKA